MTAFTLHVDRRNGQPRRLVRLEFQGREVHRDIIDTDSAWHRGLFVQAARGKEPISDDDVAWLDTALIDGAKQADTAPAAEDDLFAPIVASLVDVQAVDVDWLWPGRIALGKLTLLAGDPGNGKSLLTIDAAARVSCGRPWPDDLCDRESGGRGRATLCRGRSCRHDQAAAAGGRGRLPQHRGRHRRQLV